MRRLLLYALVVCSLMMLMGCRAEEEESFPRSKISASDAEITPYPEETVVSAWVEKVEPLEVPKEYESVSGMQFSMDSAFTIVSYAIYGRIVDTYEARLCTEYDNGKVATAYYTILDVEVIKNYTGEPYEEYSDGIMRIRYSNSSYDNCGEMFPKLKEGDECILFVADEYKVKEGADLPPKEHLDYVRYAVMFGDVHVIEPVDGGFNGYFLKAMSQGEEYEVPNQDRRKVEVCSLEEIEEIIEVNTDKMLGYSYIDWIHATFK